MSATGWRVAYDGKPYVKGDTLTVPEHLAKEWETAGYVEGQELTQ